MEQVVEKMPIYQSHKKVRALKVDGYTFIEGKMELALNSIYTLVKMEGDEAERIAKAIENAGGDLGYFVVYEDGYKSWSPTQAFEEGYSPVAMQA